MMQKENKRMSALRHDQMHLDHVFQRNYWLRLYDHLLKLHLMFYLPSYSLFCPFLIL